MFVDFECFGSSERSDKVTMMRKGTVSGKSSSYSELQNGSADARGQIRSPKTAKITVDGLAEESQDFSVNGLNRIDSRVDTLYRI